MEKEKVVEVLKYYRNIEKEIQLNKRIMRDLEDQYYSSVGAINMDGMPKAVGGTSNPTETMALNVSESVRETMIELEEENRRLCKLKTEVLRELNKLPYLHKTVVFDFYINNLQWVRISEQIHYSERQCKNIRNCALDKLKKRFDKNKTISSYDFS